MKTRGLKVMAVLFVALSACGGGDDDGNAAKATTTTTGAVTTTAAPTTVTTSPPVATTQAPAAPSATMTSLNQQGADRVKGADNGVTGDGAPDQAFTATIAGTVTNLVVVRLDENGKGTRTQWDTIVGDKPQPAGLYFTKGSETWVLGVIDEAGKLLNNADGSLTPRTFATPTRLTLHGSPDPTIAAGTKVWLFVYRADGSVTKSSLTV